MAKLFMSFVGRPAVHELQHYLKGSSSGFLRNRAIVFDFMNKNKLTLCQQRCFSTNSEKTQEKSLQQQTQSEISENVRSNTFKETTKTASYLGVILVGISVTGIMFYTVFSELFSSKSPNNVYSKALERVCSDTRVQDALGEPISGYGEENRRGRRQHVRHLPYEKDGEKRLRMKFYISGTRKRATVHLEMKEDEFGRYVYRYLFVELDDFGRHPIVFEDNRNTPSGPGANTPPEEPDPLARLNMNLNFPDAELK